MVKKNQKSTKDYILENLSLIIAFAVAIASTYVASILAPLKSDITVLANQVEHNTISIETIEEINTNTKINTNNILTIKEDLKELRNYLIK